MSIPYPIKEQVSKSHNVLRLEKCNKHQCDRCDLGYILKEYVRPMMQLLTNDISEYNMQLLTTKCLNTSVMLMFFLLGPVKGISKANKCDSNRVKEMHKNGLVTNTQVTSQMMSTILRKGRKYRQLYYILMNDAEFPYPQSNQNAFFPGHVFIIEKVPSQNEPYFYFYQSYINEYDLKGHVAKHNDTLKMTYQEVAELLKKIHYIIHNGVWDEDCVRYWKDFTYVDTSNILGSITKDNLFICCVSSKVTTCIDRIRKYASTKLKYVSSLKDEEMGKIYGSPHLYDSRERKLTNFEVKVSLESMINDMIRYKNNI